ncbi:hypothetical protein GQ457_13G015650 [Hibiscus cannabinus]
MYEIIEFRRKSIKRLHWISTRSTRINKRARKPEITFPEEEKSHNPLCKGEVSAQQGREELGGTITVFGSNVV